MLDRTTAIVTGASQGIGRQIAITLAGYGANVALAARSEDGIAETAELVDAPDRTLPVRTDITDEESVVDSIATTVDRFGGLDCVVNNAGIAGPTKPVEEVELDEWHHTMNVNAAGMFLMVKHAVEYLRESDRGRIVNLSSISGKRPLTNRTPYVASKMAVIGFTRTLAFELGPEDITVNAICPGATAGPRIDDVIDKQAERLGVGYEEAKRQVFTDDVALGILTEATDVAEMVAYLASDRAEHITAQDLNVDGGSVWY